MADTNALGLDLSFNILYKVVFETTNQVGNVFNVCNVSVVYTV